MEDLNVKHETVKRLGKNIAGTLLDLGLGCDFF